MNMTIVTGLAIAWFARGTTAWTRTLSRRAISPFPPTRMVATKLESISSIFEEARDLKGGLDGPRMRFAPSPTGSLHVGGARTALCV